MSDEKRPNVFPSKGEVENAKKWKDVATMQAYQNMSDADKVKAANDFGSEIANGFQSEIGGEVGQIGDVPEGEKVAASNMAKERAEQRKIVESGEKVIRPELAMEGHGSKGATVSYGSNTIKPETPIDDTGYITPVPPIPPTDNLNFNNNQHNGGNNANNAVTVPNYVPFDTSDVAFDVIPLPSKGLLYPGKKSTIRVAFLTASDENILTNPNLLESGKFLEILFNRKILEPGLTYKDLHVGDRNAIMLWLRATGYGEKYPVSMIDPATGEDFETDIDISKLRIITLKEVPDDECLFNIELPVSKANLKFRLLTVGDIEDIEEHVEMMKNKYGHEESDAVTYTLEKHVVEINGNRDIEFLRKTITNMRAGDSRALRKHIDSIESGVDLSLTIGTPGGGTIDTFLPLDLTFFWPDFKS